MTSVLIVVDRISALACGLARVLVIALIVAMFYEVVARYGFNAPTLWSYDVSYMLNGSIFMLGTAYTLSVNQHVRIDFLSRLMPVRLQHGINLIVLTTMFLPAITWICFRASDGAWKAFVENKVEVVSPWAPVIWPFESMLALGLICLCLQVVAQIIRHAVGVRNPEAVPTLFGHADQGAAP